MNQNSTAPHYNDDEIDLKDLLKRTINVLERGVKIIFLSILLGAILGVGYFLNSKETFQSSLVLRSNILVLANIKSLLNPIEQLLDEGNSGLLAQTLMLDENAVESLNSLEVESVFEKESDNKEEEASYFEITATVADNAILPALQKGIIAYLQNNDFVKRRVAIKEESLKALIKQVDNELKEIELLKKRVEDGSVLTSGSSNVVLMEPSNLYQQSLMMAEKKQTYVEELALVESIQVVKDFTPFSKPSSPSWVLCLVVGLAGGLIIGFAVLFFKELSRYVKS